MGKSYILKFDEIKGDYVICEQQNPKRFSLFNFKTRDEAQLDSGLKKLDDGSNQGQPQNLPVNNNLPLIASLYAKFRNLNAIYQNLSAINANYGQTFNEYVSINTALMGGLLNIYTTLSNGARLDQNEPMPALAAQGQQILAQAADYIIDMRNLNYQLLNAFAVQNIDRQLALNEVALSIQSDVINNLRLAQN